MRTPSGVRRLDDLLDGGVPLSSTTLVYGPPFIGKESLTRRFLLAGLQRGIPGIVVLTDSPASEVRTKLAVMDPDYPKYESEGLVQFIDTYSKAIGAEDDFPHAEYVDGPVNMNGIGAALNTAQRRIIEKGPTSRLVIDSVSTLITYTNANTTFRFLQVLLGKAKRAGATTMMLLGQGMHTDAEVQMVKHLADGLVEVKLDQGKTLLLVQGLGVPEGRGWVEYRSSETTFDVTGSFTSGRIR